MGVWLRALSAGTCSNLDLRSRVGSLSELWFKVKHARGWFVLAYTGRYTKMFSALPLLRVP